MAYGMQSPRIAVAGLLSVDRAMRSIVLWGFLAFCLSVLDAQTALTVKLGEAVATFFRNLDIIEKGKRTNKTR